MTSKTTAPTGSGIVIRNFTDTYLTIPQILETVVIDSRPIARQFILEPHEAREITRAQFDQLCAWDRLHGQPGWQVSGLARVEA